VSRAHIHNGGRRWALVPRGRRRAQRGQALIEFTLFFTFMMLLVTAVTDIAFLLDDHVNLVFAARQGARTGAVLGNGFTNPKTGVPLDPDCEIVGAVNATLLNQPDVKLTSITIYEVGPNEVPTGNEDVYPAGDTCDSSGKFATAPSVATWPAGNRVIDPFEEDSIGVRLDFTYSWRFNILGFPPFAGYDTVEYPLSPSGEPTPLPAPTSTPTP
jgi:hypothetical protein